jgi:hypothetical protein
MEQENISIDVQQIEIDRPLDDISVSVGETAGNIWKYLSTNKQATSIELKSKIVVSNRILYSAIGWLLREDKVIVTSIDRGLLIKLK